MGKRRLFKRQALMACAVAACVVGKAAASSPSTVPVAPVAPSPYLEGDGGNWDGSYEIVAGQYVQSVGIVSPNITVADFESVVSPTNMGGFMSTPPVEINQTVTVENGVENYFAYPQNYNVYSGGSIIGVASGGSPYALGDAFGENPNTDGGSDKESPNGLFLWGNAGYGWLRIVPGGTLNTYGSGGGYGTFVGGNTSPHLGIGPVGFNYGGPQTGYGIVDVSGGTWNDANSALEVGYGSQGFVTVQNGGHLNVNNQAIILGQNYSGSPSPSHLAAGIGTMVVQSGGTVTLTGAGGYIYVGDSTNPDGTLGGAGATGSLYVSGVGASVSASNSLVVGSGGSGTVVVTGGGVLKTSQSSGSYGSQITGGTSVGSSSGSVLVTGPGSLWNSGSYISMGQGGTAALVISDGGQVTSAGAYASSAYAYTKGGTSALSTVDIEGQGSAWIISGKADIGENGIGTITVQGSGKLSNTAIIIVGDYATGNGTLLVQSQGTVESGGATLGNQAGAIGTATVTGLNSLWTVDGDLTVGNSGQGTLTLGNSAQIITTGDAILGSQSGSTGTATITDSGTEWQINGELKVGDNGNGTMAVDNGGLVSLAGNLAIADSGGNSTLTLDGNGSRLIASGTSVTIGGQGDGTLIVQNAADAIFSGAGVSLGEKSGGTGTLTVQGSNTIMSVGSLTVGSQGTGTVNVRDSASLGTGTNISLGEQSTGSGTLTIDSASVTDAGTLSVGDYGTGKLTIQNGGSLTVQGNDIALGEQNTGTGTLNLAGSGSALTFNGDMTIGKSGSGTFAVSGGANFSGSAMTLASGSGFGAASTGGTGELDIIGASSVQLSQDLTIGKYGVGTLAMAAGAVLANKGNATLGSQPATEGSATLNGSSNWTVGGNLTVGSQGTGSITVQSASSLIANGTSFTIGKLGQGSLTVTGGKSLVQYAGDLIIGKQAVGTFSIAKGATTALTANGTGDVYIAETSGVSGTLSIDGSGSNLAATDLVIGGTSSKAGGNGNVSLTNNGTLTIAQTVTMWQDSSLNVIGGYATIGNTPPTTTTNGNIYVTGNGKLSGIGHITGNVRATSGTVDVGGTKPGNLDVTGNFLQSGGTLKFSIGGSGTGQASQLDVTGSVTISGTALEFDFVNGYAPTKGQTFQVIDPPQSVSLNNISYSFTGLRSGFLFTVNPDVNGLLFTALNNGTAASPATPEPAALSLMVGSVGMLMLLRKRRCHPIAHR